MSDKAERVGTRQHLRSTGAANVDGVEDGDVVIDPPIDPPIDPRILAAIKQVIHEEVGSRLARIDEALASLVKVNERMEALEKSMQFTAERLDATVKQLLPAITDHMAQLADGLVQQTLQIDVHRRKWNLILHGVDGPAGEDEAATRSTCVSFANSVLKVSDAKSTQFAACHRLSGKANAGIIVRFSDLAQRDRWLAGTRHLRNHAKKVTLCPDLPPVLRPSKDELMLTRSKLSPSVKAKSRVKYLPHWPFVELRIEGQPPKRSATQLSHIAAKVLGMDPLLKIRESNDTQ